MKQYRWRAIIVSLFSAVLIVFPLQATATFLDNGDGTVGDTKTALVWQQSDTQNDAGGRTWEQALSYCETLDLAGYTDWRLPNGRELEILSAINRVDPAIDPALVCTSTLYWSGSTTAIKTGSAWGVFFFDGSAFYSDKDLSSKDGFNYHVRCVRSGPFGEFESCLNPPVKLESTDLMYSDTIQNVYTNVAVDDDIIKVLDYRMEGSDNYAGVIFDRNISVALSGGFNCGYFYDAFGMTVIKGSLTISDGTVLVKNITLAE